MAIPPGAPKPTLSPLGSAIWDTLTKYGAYAVDNAGGNVFYAEAPDGDRASVDPAYQAALNLADADMPTVMSHLVWVTNNSPGQWGGPGARVASPAPAF